MYFPDATRLRLDICRLLLDLSVVHTRLDASLSLGDDVYVLKKPVARLKQAGFSSENSITQGTVTLKGLKRLVMGRDTIGVRQCEKTWPLSEAHRDKMRAFYKAFRREVKLAAQ